MHRLTRALLLGDVCEDGNGRHDTTSGIPQRRDRNVDVDRFAVASLVPARVALQGAAAKHPLDEVVDVGFGLGGDEWWRAADDVFGGPAEQLLGRVVPHVHRAVAVERKDGKRRRLHDRAEHGFAPPACGLGRVPFGEVTRERGVILDLAAFVVVCNNDDFDRKGAAGAVHGDELAGPLALGLERLSEVDEDTVRRVEIIGRAERRNGIVPADLEELACGGVREKHAAVTVVERHEVGRGLDRAAEHRGPAFECSLVGDVDDRADEAVHRAVGVNDRRALCVQPACFTGPAPNAELDVRLASLRGDQLA